QQRALDAESDRIGRRVALAAAPSSFGGLQRGQQLAANGGGPRAHRDHQRRRRGASRARPTTRTSSGAPRPAGRDQPRSSAATSSCTVARSSSRSSSTLEAPSVATLLTHAPHAAQPSAPRDSPPSAPTSPRRRVWSSVPQNG